MIINDYVNSAFIDTMYNNINCNEYMLWSMTLMTSLVKSENNMFI